jgi:hypothetical protein
LAAAEEEGGGGGYKFSNHYHFLLFYCSPVSVNIYSVVCVVKKNCSHTKMMAISHCPENGGTY